MSQPRALVTGTSSGIGQAIAEHLLAHGWEVVGLARRQHDLGPGFRWVAADAGEVTSLGEVLADLEPVQALVHAAGFQRTSFLGELRHEDLAEMFAVHVAAASELANIIAPRLPQGGRIVLIGSRTATGVAGKSHYVATKSALIGMARSWAQELAPREITVNLVSPGPTSTPMLADPSRAATPPQVPALGTLVDPADVAALTAFLLGEHGKSITGQNFVICGGASL